MDKCPEHSAHDQHLDRLDARVLELEDANKELSRFTERITVLVDKYDETLDDHAARLAALESIPARRWEQIANYTLTAALGAAAGLRAAAIRAAKTAAQAAIGTIGASTALGAVDWPLAASAAALAAIASLLTSIGGLPEVDGGSTLPSLAKGGE